MENVIKHRYVLNEFVYVDEIIETGKDKYDNRCFKGQVNDKVFTLIALPKKPNKMGRISHLRQGYKLWHNGKFIYVNTYSPENPCVMSTIKVDFLEFAYGDGEGGLDECNVEFPKGITVESFMHENFDVVVSLAFLTILEKYPEKFQSPVGK